MKQVSYITGKVTPQTAWDALSMTQKSEMMKVAVRHGITNLQEIKQKYNEFAEGGQIPPYTPAIDDVEAPEYRDYLRQMAKNREQAFIENYGNSPSAEEFYNSFLSNDGGSFNYRRWYNLASPEEREWGLKKGLAHWTDASGKTYLHPTFSIESPYSGYVNPYNPKGIVGGTWLNTGDPHNERYEFSKDQMSGDWPINKTLEEFVWARENEDTNPYAVFEGGYVLPEVIVNGKKHSIGGPLVDYALNRMAEGGKIHIKESKKGTFTAAASRHNMGVQEFASKVLANKDDYSPAMVKKANFARNASHWHGFGGPLFEPNNIFDDGGELTKVQGPHGYYYTTTDSRGYTIRYMRMPRQSDEQYEQMVAERRRATNRRAAANRERYERRQRANAEGAARFNRAANTVMTVMTQQANETPFTGQEYQQAAETQRQQKVQDFHDKMNEFAAGAKAVATATGIMGGFGTLGTQLGAGLLGGESVDAATQGLTPYSSWGDMVSQTTGMPQWAAGLSNPGYFFPYAKAGRLVINTAKPTTMQRPVFSGEQEAFRFPFSGGSVQGTITEPEINTALQAAQNYKTSQGYRTLVDNARRESQQLGIGDFSENFFLGTGNPEFPTVQLSTRPKGKLGGYRVGDNTLNLDPAQLNPEEAIGVPYHEGIHWQRVGIPELTTPKYKAWINSLNQPKEIQDRLWSEFYNSDEYQLLLQRDKATEYLNQKINTALYDEAGPYLRKEGELQANGLEAGRILGIEPFTPFPGVKKALEVVEPARKYNSWLWDVKAGNESEVRNFWNILTGQYAPALFPVTIGGTMLGVSDK